MSASCCEYGASICTTAMHFHACPLLVGFWLFCPVQSDFFQNDSLEHLLVLQDTQLQEVERRLETLATQQAAAQRHFAAHTAFLLRRVSEMLAARDRLSESRCWQGSAQLQALHSMNQRLATENAQLACEVAFFKAHVFAVSDTTQQAPLHKPPSSAQLQHRASAMLKDEKRVWKEHKSALQRYFLTKEAGADEHADQCATIDWKQLVAELQRDVQHLQYGQLHNNERTKQQCSSTEGQRAGLETLGKDKAVRQLLDASVWAAKALEEQQAESRLHHVPDDCAIQAADDKAKQQAVDSLSWHCAFEQVKIELQQAELHGALCI